MTEPEKDWKKTWVPVPVKSVRRLSQLLRRLVEIIEENADGVDYVRTRNFQLGNKEASRKKQ